MGAAQNAAAPKSRGPMIAERWEVGSEFHLAPMPAGPRIPWPEPAIWYSLARHAVSALLRMRGPRPRLWVPEYFCHDVAESWWKDADLATYRDDPDAAEPAWDTLRPQADDFVLALNFFGVRSQQPWAEWRKAVSCTVVEDHSHDPASLWARNSSAEYAFSSVRKTLPVPDGGILWSPLGHPLPTRLPDGHWTSAAMKLAAMPLKADYLSGARDESIKQVFRTLQTDGESGMALSLPTSPLPFTSAFLAAGVPEAWRIARRENVARLLSSLGDVSVARPLFRAWPAESAPFAAVLLFDEPGERDRYRRLLQEQRVFCPVHWPQGPDAPERVRNLADRLLTIPSDQRYSAADMDRVAGILRQGSAG